MFKGNHLQGTANIISGFFLIYNLYYLLHHKLREWNVIGGIFVFCLLLSMLYWSSEEGQATYLWYYTLPAISTFLLGSKRGVIAIRIMYIPLMLSMLLGQHISFIADYGWQFELRFFLSYGIVGYLSLLFEKITEKNYAEINELNQSLEMKVEARTKELEHKNELLAIKISESEAAEEKISIALREKEVLLKEVYHRTKNNMNLIASLLDIQQRHVKKEDIEDAFSLLANRVRSMSMIHEGLYESDNVATIDLAEYLSNLGLRLREAYTDESQEVDIQIIAEDIPIGLNQAIPLGLALNEIFTNAFKHALTESSPLQIQIELKKDDAAHICLNITDNGPGLPEDYLTRTKSSLGTHLIHILIREQLNGAVEVDSDDGTTYRITFPQL